MRLTIFAKLLITFLIIISLLAGISWISLTDIRQIVYYLTKGEQHYTAIVTAATEASSFAKRAEGHLFMYLSLHDEADKGRFAARCASLQERIEILDKNVHDPDARALLDRIRILAVDVFPLGKQLIETHDRDKARTGKFDIEKHGELLKKLFATTSTIRELSVQLATYELTMQSAIKAAAIKQAEVLKVELTWLGLISCSLALVASYFISRAVSRPIIKLNAMAGEIGIGNLGVRSDIKSKDEIGVLAGSLNKMVEDLEKSALQLRANEQLLMSSNKLLQESEEKFKTLFNSANDAIFTMNHTTFLDCNATTEKIFGCSRDQIVGHSPVDFSPELQPDGSFSSKSAAEKIEAAFSGTPQFFDWLHTRLDGTPFYAEVSLNRVYIGDEFILQAIVRDITERKNAEATKKSLEAQLQQAQKLEGIGTLASGIAHDFNNILGIILGYSVLLERLRENPQKHSESVEAITKATKRGASLVKQLLIFARKHEMLLESVSINDTIGEISKLLKETFPKTITITTSLQQDLPVIVADASQIHQVLLNLSVNARDAMPKSGTLTISTRTIESEAIRSRFAKATAQQYVQIEVADTGIGMDDTTRERIFEPFFTTKGPGKGTGLGLAVVYGIIENHGGFIDVQSAPGVGTSFTMYLPIPERTVEEVPVTGKDLGEIPGGTETILIIEDEEMLRGLLRSSLSLKGYTILIAEDGRQGVEKYQSHQEKIAVVISDMGLPILNGQDVFRKIREINPQAKVILASGFFDPEVRSEMYKAGLKDFIQKPYLVDEVLQKIREAIDTNG